MSAEDADMAAIVAVIRTETEAFQAKNFNAWADCWLHSERSVGLWRAPEFGVLLRRGWDAIAVTIGAAMGADPEPLHAPFRQENHVVTVSGDLAWVTFEQFGEGRSSDPMNLPDDDFETRILERHEGVWKIVYLSFDSVREEMKSGAHLEVDADGRLLWASNPAREMLKAHPGLTLSAGRVRAVQHSHDKALQETLANAGRLRDGFEARRYVRETGRDAVFPVVLGEDDAGGVMLCLVLVRNATLYIALGDRELIARKLEIATAVFGLSETQSRLAAELVDGRNLPAAAEAMGITVNTARTHLNRIYNKIGVTGQAALFRVLLSVGTG